MKSCKTFVTNPCFLVQSQLNKLGAELLWAAAGVKPCTPRSVLIISKAQFEWCRSWHGACFVHSGFMRNQPVGALLRAFTGFFYWVRLPQPPPPGVSMRKTSPIFTRKLALAGTCARFPSRSSVLRPGAPLLPPESP